MIRGIFIVNVIIGSKIPNDFFLIICIHLLLCEDEYNAFGA